jgi:5'-3' exonuclease
VTDLIVDGNSLYARSWYAVTKDNGIDANHVIRSALQSVYSLINPDVDRIGERIDRTLFCWDGDNHGHDKGQRQEKPPEYAECREILKEVLTATIGAAHCQADEHEADDTVATAIHQSDARLIYIASGDKDLMQLLSSRVRYYCLNQKMILTRQYVLNKFGVKAPEQVAIALAILGDKIDNISGIKGWGPAKVKKLFQQVPDEADLEEALNVVDAQIPAEFKDAFWSSLDRTLLNPKVPNVCAAVPLDFCCPEEAIEIGITGIEDAFCRMYANHTGIKLSPRVAHRLGIDDEVD